MKPGGAEIHVWDIDLDSAAADVALLAADERDRAARFLFDIHRRRFIAGRAALRRILGRYVGTDAAAIQFRYNRFGKPDLDRATGIRFNASHSSGRQMIAVTCGREIGIDVERIRDGIPFSAIAARFLPPPEAAGARTAEQFFRAWTRREAFLKAAGFGLSGLRAPVPPGWTIEDLHAGEGWTAALAMEGGQCRICRRVSLG